jgi:N-acetylglucosaminyl-diphospho-decaprenol L-rhamnosyltransferase
VVVDYAAGAVLGECVWSLLGDGVAEVVVVENGDASGARTVLDDAGLAVPVVESGRNLGYGAGANRGVAATGSDGGVATAGATEHVLICNPDLHVHRGCLGALVRALEDHPAWAIVGPRILTPDGVPYPSVRRFPSMVDAVGHAVLGGFRPDNPFTRRYRADVPGGGGPAPADWVSGACFLARRSAFEELGGFDEGYFMFAEDMDLCWRAHRSGWGVGFQPGAAVTHVQGVSTRRHPYRMLVAHHRSALRFACRSTEGWRRAMLPLAAGVLGLRLAVSLAAAALRAGRG